jgi:hypothetical protein
MATEMKTRFLPLTLQPCLACEDSIYLVDNHTNERLKQKSNEASMYADGNNCLIAVTEEPQRHFLEKSNRRGDCCFEAHLSSG